MASICGRPINERERIALPPRVKEISGETFHRLVALWPVERRKNRHVLYLCRCECGEELFVTCSNLRSGHTRSCGCLQIEAASVANSRHGLSDDRLYGVWMQMRQRCSLETAPNYKYYGARGISVCERWNTSFEAFAEDMGERPEGASLDRIDNDGPYAPWNCRWTTSQSEQVRNSRAVKNAFRLEYNGMSLTLSEWSAKTGISTAAIRSRLLREWAVERVLSENRQRNNS